MRYGEQVAEAETVSRDLLAAPEPSVGGSGLIQGAGGVGGLLEEADDGVGTNFVAYDGNGNVKP